MEARSARDHGDLNQRPPWSYGFSLVGFSWPPQRSSSPYTCGYCKRELRSAQALGGHMNVHRRERARHRQCTHNPSPSHTAPLPNLNFSPPHCAGEGGDTSTARPVIYSFFSTTTPAAATKSLEVNLELGVGICSAGGGDGMEGELDLELRLGCS